MTADARDVLPALAAGLHGALAGSLVGLYVHGSWVSGDFSPDRSDLDLLAVLDSDPTEATVAALAPALARVERQHPSWRGRLEVEVVGLETVRRAATDVGGRPSLTEHRMVRVSPGEPLHLLPASSHRLLTWATVRSVGVPLVGPPPAAVLPPVRSSAVREALLDHVRDWPTWVRGMRGPGGQAYAVLTVCRAARRLEDGEQLSKRRAADAVVDAMPRWADVIRWARDWWYAGGSDDADPHPDTMAFVDEVAADLVRTHGDLTTG